ncbi:MAG: response regulator [Candidatus Aminicenantes bacterium]|nr:MAG: response regulator [Candidatus Aminicenantes bacterium]
MSKKIVVVDDDKAILKLLKAYLKKHKFHVFCATDGSQGFDLVKKEKPDILITDMLIPKIHGLDLCRKVKDDPDLENVRVVLMSGLYGKTTFRDDMEGSNADDFIKKPIDLKQLKDLIDKLLGMKKEKDLDKAPDFYEVD